jgi:hypothetical protein
MKNISIRFLLNNIVTAVSIILGIKALRGEGTDIWERQNILYGVLILTAFLIGSFVSVLKARELASQRQRSTSVYQNLFLMVLYLYAFICNAFMASLGVSYIFGGIRDAPAIVSIGLLLLFVVSIGSLIQEGKGLGRRFQPMMGKSKRQMVNIGLMMYTSLGIGSAWQLMIVGETEVLTWGQQGFFNDLSCPEKS